MKVKGQAIADRYSLYHGDTIEVAQAMESESVDFSVFSPPFESLFTYSSSPRDLGNCASSNEFWAQYRFLITETMRVMVPGRLVAIHVMNLPTSKSMHGHIGLRDFRGEMIRAYQEAGFIYHSEVCIFKCPVVAMQRTKAIGLLHKQLKKDSAMSRQGLPDYLVVMRKPGSNPKPVSRTAAEFPVELWQRYASPIWAVSEGVDDDGFEILAADINQSETLQYRSARDAADEKHVAPLQLEVIRRAIRLWSRPDDMVWSPFAGIGSEGYVALQEGRRFIGAELKDSYFAQAARNLAAASAPSKQLGLFDGAAE